MTEQIPSEEQSNYEIFRDCLSEPVLKALATPTAKPKKQKRAHRKKGSGGQALEEKNEDKKGETNVDEDTTAAEDLSEFIDYLASLIFTSLPLDLRTLSHAKWKDTPLLQTRYSTPLTAPTTLQLVSTITPPAIDSLTSYSLLPSPPDDPSLHHLFTPLLTAYITSTTAPPPVWSTTRTPDCELCHREHIPLTYHHLIPRSTHERVLKRGWHREEVLNTVAWLCRACHSFVHGCASNEELAREWYSVELLEGREDVQGWVRWVGRVRWKKR
ncbi:hypothetical protein P154DRAFT_479733 [Amniculicola lignicola CBS 123094]|uniref:HNH domain-containing protein n=1 Tax=Amniculicola lignicola CBS 123094 TaxID=1392246 RepID=A0A6A5X5S7_9PLEO|nr:hypothetical protein P154DRAFT_479733 [Amniculicola lignicola CBS 123094]